MINIKLDNLTEPVNRLLKMIDDVYVQPSSIKRIAKAEAYAIESKAKAEHKAEKIKTDSEIELAELKFRAAQRFLSEQMILQGNLENTSTKSIPYMDENATPDNMDKDWLFNYLVNCQMVSDSDMQEMWAKILAGEANQPGSFSKRAVNQMKDLTDDGKKLPDMQRSQQYIPRKQSSCARNAKYYLDKKGGEAGDRILKQPNTHECLACYYSKHTTLQNFRFKQSDSGHSA